MPKTDLNTLPVAPPGYEWVPDVTVSGELEAPAGYEWVPEASELPPAPKGYSWEPEVQSGKRDLNVVQPGSLVTPAATGGTSQAVAPKEQVEGPVSSSSEPERPSFFSRVVENADTIAGKVPGFNLGIATAKMAPSLWTGAQKSFAQQQVDIETAKGAFGYETPEQAAENVLREQQDVAQYKYEKEVEEALLAFSQIPSGDIAKQIGWYATNGKALGAQIGESAAGMTNSIALSLGMGAAGSLAGPIGTVIGAGTGAGLGSAISEASAALLEYGAKNGVDIESKEELRNYFANPEMMSKAKQYAVTRGVAIGVVDGLTSLFAAKGLGKAVADPIATWVTGKATTVAAKKASLGELGVNTAVDALGGGGGEVLAGALTDGVDWKDVLAEVVVGGIAGVPGTLYETGIAQNQRAGRAPTVEEILASAGGTPEASEAAPISYEDAIAQGRTQFGWYEGGADELQVGTYEEAEAKAAQGDIRRGAIFAVKPEETATDVGMLKEKLVSNVTQGDSVAVIQTIEDYRNDSKQGTKKAFVQQLSAIEKSLMDLAASVGTATSGTPVDLTQIATQVDNLLQGLPPSATVYRADTGTAVRVIPRERNLLHDTVLDDINPAVEFRTRNKTESHVDLDILRQELETRGGKIIPNAKNIKDIFTKLGGMETLRNIFKLTPHAETMLSNPKLSERDIEALLDSKDMEWKTGRYDERVLVHGFELKSPTGSFTSQEREELYKKTETKIIAPPSTELRVQNQVVDVSFNSPKVFDGIVDLFDGTSNVVVASKDPVTRKLGKWLEALQTRLESTITRVYLVDTTFSKTPEFAKLKASNPALAESLKKEIRAAKTKLSWAGFHLYAPDANASFIWVDGDSKFTLEDRYRTLAHEYGHHLSATLFARLSLEVQLRLQGAWRRWLQDMRITSSTEKQAWLRRRFGMGGNWAERDAEWNTKQVMKDTNYFFSFEEFFAEQVARWATTDRRALGLLSRFYKDVARKIVIVFRELQKTIGTQAEATFRPEAEFDNWLRTLYYGQTTTDWFAGHKSFADEKTKERNAKFFGSLAMPMQEETAPIAQVMKTFAGGAKGPFGIRASSAPSVPTNTGRLITKTQAFLEWFGGSKVVDDNGNPIVVYHGTAKGDFSEFNTYGSNYGLMGQGGYFTESPAVASEYTDKGIVQMQRRGENVSLTVIPVYLSIKNPLDMDAAPNTAAWAAAYSEYISLKDITGLKTNEEVYRLIEDFLAGEMIPKYDGAEIMQDGLRSMGFDGITHIGGGRRDPNSVKHRVWVAFDPTQIKSIYNSGTFDPTNPSISYSPAAPRSSQSVGPPTPRLLAHIDRFNKFLKWAINFRQLADLNPHIRELQEYREWMELSKLDTAKIMVRAEDRVKRWKKLPAQQGAALNDFLFAMNMMDYLSAQEKAAGIRRWPTPGELTAMVQSHGLAVDTYQLYKDIKTDFLEVTQRTEQLQTMAAMKLTNSVAQQAAIREAQATAQRMRGAPYFPQTRFGKFSLTVRDANGRLEHFELFETNRELKAAIKLALQTYPPGQWDITPSTISEEVKPYIGVPSWMLDKLFAMPNVTPTQKQWIEQLRYMLAPQRSFAKHLLKKKNYAGFSLDGRRAYASYFFHHARNYSRIKYQDQLLGTIDALTKSAPTNHDMVVKGAYKRNMMADFLRKAYEDHVNPGNDWAAIRSFVAIWYLGAVPASALLNLFQTPLVSFNYASAKFGTAKSTGAFIRTTKDFKTYYKKGNIAGQTGASMRAIARAVEMGLIDESMAAELAATAIGSGNWMGKTYAGDKLKSGWLQVADKSMFMFRMAEQGNRRITFRTFYMLAMENPTNPWLDTLEQKYFLEFQGLIQAGYTVREARGYLAGKDGVITTHYTYDRDARPAFMRGKQSVLFAFYMFTQNTVFMLYNNPQTAMRWALMMALVAGVRGLVPDDVEDMIKAIGAKMGWNIEEEARRFVSELIGDESELATDLVMNGAGRYSFGIPALMEMAGANGVPTFDLSRMLAFQRVLPINPVAMFEPGKEWNEKVTKATEGAAGAAFGIPIAVTKAMMGSDLDILDAKRWEGALPRALRLGARTFRQVYEGGERDKNYNQYLEYDLSVPEDVGDLIGKAMGFTPTRESIKWDEQQMMREVQGFWQIRRELLLREAYEELHVKKDKEEYRGVLKKIRDYNQQTPDKKLAISVDTLKKSFMAKLKKKAQIERGDNPFVNPQMEDRVKTLFPQSEEVERKKVK